MAYTRICRHRLNPCCRILCRSRWSLCIPSQLILCESLAALFHHRRDNGNPFLMDEFADAVAAVEDTVKALSLDLGDRPS